MDNLTPAQKKRLEKLASVMEEGNVGVLEYLNELEDIFETKFDELKASIPNLDDVLASVRGVDGETGEAGEQGEVGEKGDTGPQGIQGIQGIQGPVGPQGVQGIPGKDGANGDTGPAGKDGLDGSPDTADTIRNKLEVLPDGEKLSIDAIQDLRAELEKLPEREKGIVMGANRALYQLLDVNVAGVTSGQSIRWDGQQWVAYTPGGGSSPLTTKGDLYGFSTVDARIPVGADTFVLTADSTQALGVKWAAPAAGSGTVTTVGSADGSVTITNATTTPDLAVVKAPKLSTARTIAGTSFDGTANITLANKFIVQGTADTGLTGAQFLGALGTGIVKNTTTTGVLSIAVAGDFPTLNQNTTGTAANVTTNANLTGPITSVGNATSIASQTGTGTKFVVDTSPILVTPNIGTATGTGLIITSTSATAFAVGPAGSTTPVLNVNANTASAVSGISITGAATGVAPTITVTDSGTNCGLTINTKGSGQLTLNGNAGGGSASAGVTIQASTGAKITMATNAFTFGTLATLITATTVRFGFTGAADVTLTASTEAPSVLFDISQTRQHAAGTLALQRDFQISGSNHSFASASTLTDQAVLGLNFSTGTSANGTITNLHGLYIPTVTLTGTKTNAYAITAVSPSGAGTINAAAQFTGAVYFNDGTDATKRAKFDISAVSTATVRTITIPDSTGTMTLIAATQNLTNKRITRRLVTVNAPGATPATNTDNVDIANFTGLNAAITSMSTNLTGTRSDGDLVEFRFTDDGTARAITWGASFGATTVVLPTTTVISTMLRVLFEYNGTILQCIAVA